MAGGVFGLIMLENLEVTWMESYVIVPLAYLFAAVVGTWAVVNYSTEVTIQLST